MKYCQPETPSVYWINKINCCCKACGNVFELHTPNGDDGVVKFVETNGTEIRWLPMHGEGGYLDLFEKLMPGFLASRKEITPSVSLQFNQMLQSHIQPSETGNGFEINNKVFCPKCKKQDVNILDETVLTSPEVIWIKIDCNLLKIQK